MRPNGSLCARKMSVYGTSMVWLGGRFWLGGAWAYIPIPVLPTLCTPIKALCNRSRYVCASWHALPYVVQRAFGAAPYCRYGTGTYNMPLYPFSRRMAHGWALVPRCLIQSIPTPRPQVCSPFLLHHRESIHIAPCYRLLFLPWHLFGFRVFNFVANADFWA